MSSAKLILYADTRIGGSVEWVYGNPEEVGTRFPDRFNDCVCYLGAKQGEGIVWGGTAFFVSLPGETFEGVHVYVVTAKHNLRAAQNLGPELYARVNAQDGGVENIRLPDKWIEPDSKAVDVVVLPLLIPRIQFAVRAFPSKCFATTEKIEQEHIGVGDDLNIIGLFTQRAGLQRNLPIVRAGIISAMPDEPLPDRATGLPYAAYLAEVRSIGGLSGSPVLAMIHHGRTVEGAPLTIRRSYYLIGLIRGHWDLNLKEDAPQLSNELLQANTGIAIITPVQEMLDILNREDLVEERRRQEREFLKSQAATED